MSELGSLSQSARQNQLKGARITFIIIGLLTLLMNGFLLFQSEKEIDEAINSEIAAMGPGMVVDQDELKKARQQALDTVRLIYGSATALGAVFIALGIFIYAAPVPIVITGLVLYIASAAIYGLISPETLARGAVIKIIIIVTLVKSVQAAFAYQKERDMELASLPGNTFDRGL